MHMTGLLDHRWNHYYALLIDFSIQVEEQGFRIIDDKVVVATGEGERYV